MKKAEIEEALATIASYYRVKFDEKAKNQWRFHFADEISEYFYMALEKYLSLSEWAPKIADIKGIIAEIRRPDILHPKDAWATTYNSLVAASEFDEMPELPKIVAECIAELGWASLMALVRGDKAIIARSAFLDQYDAIYRREREKSMMPPKLYDLIETEREKNGKETIQLINEAKKRREEHEKLFEQFKNC